MYITKKHLPRRTFLRGAGAAVALPLLDAMIPSATALANTAARPKPRMAFCYLPHGVIQRSWVPPTEGVDFQLSRILEPLAPFKKQITVVSGLGNRPAVSSAVHAITPGTWLSCVSPEKSHAPRGGTTIDQIAAQHIGQETPLPSIEVTTERRGGTAACDGIYGCGFGSTISFRTPTTPLPMEYNPRKVFQRIFGQGDTPAERAAINADYKSVLDMVMAHAGDLRRSLGAADRVTLDTYLQSVREIERRVELAEASDLSQVELPEVPAGLPDFDARLRLMFDMIAVAYQADVTRVAAFMMAAEVSNQAYTHLGIRDAFHPLSHHNNDPVQLEKLVTLQRYHSEVFAGFLDKLAGTPDGEGSVLDQTVVLYGGNMSDGARHDHFPLPLLVAGGAGMLKGNRHVRYPDHTPLANLLLTLVNRVGVELESFGDSTGQLAEI